MRISRILLVTKLFLGFFAFSTLSAQIRIMGSNESVQEGQEVCVKISVSGFQKIISTQFSINWDETVLQFKEIRNWRYAETSEIPITFGTQDAAKGILFFSWSNTNYTNGESLPDNSTFFEVCFTAIGQEGQFSMVDITGDPREIEISDVDGIISATTNGGRVNIGEPIEGGLTINFGTVEASMGQDVCVPVKVFGFRNMVSLQHTIKWDPSALTFKNVQNFIFSASIPLTFGDQNKDQGEITFLWIDPGVALGNTQPDGTTIYELCFEAVGDCETSVPIVISSSPVELEASDTSGAIPINTKNGAVNIGTCTYSVIVASALNPCPGQTNGSVSITVFGGSNNTTYSWSNGSTTQNLANLGPGTYQVTVSDPTHGNISLDQAVVLSDNAMDISANITDPSTSSSSDAKIDVTVTNGSLPYTFMWNNGTTTEDLNNIPEGTYKVTVTDGNQCTAEKEFVVTLGIKVASATVTQISCNGANDGAINIAIGGGNGSYTYKWSNDATTEDLSNLGPGSYSVTVTDGGGLTATGGAYTITEPSEISIEGTVTNLMDGNMGAIVLDVTGGTANYSFNWSSGATSKNINQLAAGTYSVTVTDANNCTNTASFNVLPEEFIVTFESTDVACGGDKNGSITATAQNGIDPISYTWSNGATTASIQNLEGGDYTITVTDGANNEFTGSVTITEPEKLTVKVDVTPALGGPIGTATAIVQGGVPPYQYAWSPVNAVTQKISNLSTGKYTVIITDDNGCQASGANVVPETDRECYSSRLVITPNGDARNDNLEIACSQDNQSNLLIFNSHGQLVYEQDNYDNNWQGTDNGGEAVDDGVYYWVLNVTLDNNDKRVFKGHVTVLRKLN